MYFQGKINQWDFFQNERCQVVIFETFALHYSGPMPSTHFIRSRPTEHWGAGSKGKLIKLLLLSSSDSCGWRSVYHHNLMCTFVITFVDFNYPSCLILFSVILDNEVLMGAELHTHKRVYTCLHSAQVVHDECGTVNTTFVYKILVYFYGSHYVRMYKMYLIKQL